MERHDQPSVDQWIQAHPELSGYRERWDQALRDVMQKYAVPGASDHPIGMLPSDGEVATGRQIDRKNEHFGFLILSAPSGGGKRTVGAALERAGFDRLTRYTTRQLRLGERDGVDYHHVSREEFLAMNKRGELFPWVETHGEVRATSKKHFQELLDARCPFYVEGSVKAYDQFLNEQLVQQAHPLSIFLLPKDFQTLVGRLLGRGDTVNDSEILERIDAGVAHLRKAMSSPYDGFVLNDDAERAGKAIASHFFHP